VVSTIVSLYFTLRRMRTKRGAALALVQAAVARAQIALQAAVVEQMPPAAGVGGHGAHDRRSASRHLSTR
jgi:hypothetical protein